MKKKNSSIKNSNKLQTFRKITWQLMRADLRVIVKDIKDKWINALLWGSCTLIVIAYIMPAFGLKDFGLFQAASILISVIGFETYNQMFIIVMNLEQRKYMFYLFTLPIPVACIFFQKIMTYTINSMLISLFMIPLSKLILLDQMNLATINWTKLLFAITISSFFFSCFLIFIVSFAKKTSQVEHIFMRVVFPLWFFGGFQFSWQKLFEINQYAAYCSLISPYTYATEAVRVAFFGQAEFIQYWICITSMLIGSAFFGIYGYKRLKKRLDLA